MRSRHKNLELYNAKRAVYREKNRERIRQRERERKTRIIARIGLEVYRQIAHQHYLKNREKRLAQHAEYRKRVGRETIRRWANERYRRNAPAIQKYIKERLLKIKIAGIHTTEEWQALKKLFRYRCALCRRRKPLTKDHIIPLIHGGTNDIGNIQPLCGRCNSFKRERLEFAFQPIP
jgi:5-methylcytosine-specific restriction endonuclease McrA